VINSTVLVLDGDNTIWDTDAVFRSAQIALLEIFVEAGMISQPNLEILRAVDRALMSKLGRAEYDFRLLSRALVYHFQNRTVSEAVNAALTQTSLTINPELPELAYQAFKRELEKVPDLYPETVPAISTIRASISPLITILFSEGNTTRIERILETHDVHRQGLFDKIVLAPKNKESFEQVKESGLQLLPLSDKQEVAFVMVGDSIHHDIRPANQAGFATIYKPAAFKGVESPTEPDEQPSYTIQSLRMLPSILMQVAVNRPRY
jgi:FMN phosphatase YigB (HAD superfamily)